MTGPDRPDDATGQIAVAPLPPELARALGTDRRRLAGWGTGLLLAGLGSLVGWAALAPIHSAAIAPGVVKVAGERKTIQHLEGGIVREILVREDQRVDTGDVLMLLDDLGARTRHSLLQGEHDAVSAELARLEAERDGRAGSPLFAPELLARRDDARIARLLDGEVQLLASRNAALRGQLDVLAQRQQQARERIAGREAEIAATRTKLGFITEELEGAKSLLEVGIYLKTRYWALKRAEADLEAEIGRLRADIAEARAQIGEAELRRLDLRNQQRRDASDRIQDLRARLRDLGERLAAADDALTRTRITAPQPGTVIGLQVHTRGGVIRPGAPIMDLVPRDERLLVEARIRPEDIDRVRRGMPAEVRFTAFNQRTTPVFPGEVMRVSADRFTDPTHGLAWYVAQVAIDAGQGAKLALQPGMPAEVYIVTGERTVLSYLVRPIREQIRRSMLEP
jgi:HlyD family type I secretion membrane fusion protein